MKNARLVVMMLLCSVTLLWAQPAGEKEAPSILETLGREAARLEPWVSSNVARAFLSSVQRLPAPRSRTILQDTQSGRFHSKNDVKAMDREQRATLEKKVLEPATYYTTRYGTPLAYSRVVDLLGRHGLVSLAGQRILDFGYGGIGHLKLMAFEGADVVGVDVDSYLAALYSAEGDQGKHANPDGPDGSIRLLEGQWPAEPEMRAAVGTGYDVFLSKNTLKRGYIHPERHADPARLVQLGVEDEAFVRNLYEILKPGGVAAFYNLSPAQNPPDKPYLPWADGRCPFAKELLESSGFEILAYDQDDTAAAREMARLLGWDELGMDLDNGLFGHVTLIRKSAKSD
jgi:SAM-dependent methyltransferase